MDLDSTYHFDADSDPYQNDGNLRPLACRPADPPRLYFELTQLLDFEFDPDLESDPAFQLIQTQIRLFTLMCIRIRLPKILLIYPDPQSLQKIVLPFRVKKMTRYISQVEATLMPPFLFIAATHLRNQNL